MEKKIGSLEHVSGHTYDTIYDLLFTTERIIAVIIRHPNDSIHRIGLTGLLLGERLAGGNNRFQRLKVAEERRRGYQEKSFDEIVKSHRFNLEIRYDKVTSVEITRGIFKSRLRFRISLPSISERAIQFTLSKNQVPTARNLLDLALPSKLKGR
jgi:hypothetical protein